MMSDLTAVDLFSGLGGNTEGAHQAGVKVVRAANHWPAAVAAHSLNHPDTEHDLQDLQQANFHDWPDHDILMASPACQGFSIARGTDKPRHDVCRSTAWAVVACAEARRPKALFVENVVEFQRWNLFPQWRSCLEQLGYVLHPNVLDAADFGVPQNRVRLFVTGVRRDVSTNPVVVTPPKLDHVPASTIIDWDSGPWSSVHTKVEATRRRWGNGRRNHGERFLMPYFGSGSGLTGRALSRPLGTVTTRDRWAVVDGERMRTLRARECLRAQAFPAHYRLTGNHRTDVMLVGNAVAPPCAKAVVAALADLLE